MFVVMMKFSFEKEFQLNLKLDEVGVE